MVLLYHLRDDLDVTVQDFLIIAVDFNEKLRCLPFVYLTGFAILRLATPLDDTRVDFMVNKVPFERLLRVVKDLTGQGGDNSSGTPAIGTA